jgi:hypothetical protein
VAIDFPNSPALNAYFESNGKAWTFNGTSWDIVQTPANLSIANGSITGAKLASGAAVTNIGYTPANTASPTFTGTVVLPSDTSIGTITSTELGYVDGVTSAIQTQLNAKAPSASPTFTGTVTVSNDLTVSGDFTVSGTTTTINTETVTVNDNIIVLNNNASGAPTENAGIEIERGSSTNVQIRWNETTDKWQFTNDGTNYTDFGAGGATISDTAPVSPEVGSLWFESDTAQTFVYYDSSWIEIGATAMGATVSTTAPNSPIGGQIWFNSDTGGTYVYYGSAWVEVGAAPVNLLLQAIDAKGDLLVGTADNAVDNLTVGANGSVLMVDSSTATGLKWAVSPETDLVTTKGDLLVGTAADTLARQGVGSNGQVLVADSGVTNGVAWVDPQTNRNVIINGAMQVHQRGTSTAGITGGGYYTADRWNHNLSTCGTWTSSIENDAPTGSGFRKSLKMLVTTANTSPSFGNFRQVFEGQNVQQFLKGTSSAKQFTLSFWVKSNVTGTFVVEMYDLDNSRFISNAYTISAAATWEKKTMIFPADTIGAFDNDNLDSFYIGWGLGFSSTFNSGTLPTAWGSVTNANRYAGQTNVAAAVNNYWQITGVQLEAGAVATPFEFEQISTTIAKCQRYYWRSTTGLTTDGNSRHAHFRRLNSYTMIATGHCAFPVTMRAEPTVGLYNGNGVGFVDGYGLGQEGYVIASGEGMSVHGIGILVKYTNSTLATTTAFNADPANISYWANIEASAEL